MPQSPTDLATAPSNGRPDPISPPLRDVLAVFGESLPTVRIPDVDNDTLQAQAAVVVEADAAVAKLEQALDAARRALEESQEALLHKAQRATAYARVYAEGNDAALLARLDSIQLSRARPAVAMAAATTTEAPKRRGRPPKNADASLFAVAKENAPVVRSDQKQREQLERAFDAADDSDARTNPGSPAARLDSNDVDSSEGDSVESDSSEGEAHAA
jgi:hypothetical protein